MDAIEDAITMCIAASAFLIVVLFVMIGAQNYILNNSDEQIREYVGLVSRVEYNYDGTNTIIVTGLYPNPRFTKIDAQKIGKIIPGERYIFTVKYDKTGGYWRVCNPTLVENDCKKNECD